MDKRALHLDVEVFINYFLLGLLDDTGERYVAFEMYEGHPFPTEKARRLLEHPAVEVYTFNGLNYDVPLVRMALAGSSCAEIKEASNAIIEGNLKGWQFEKGRSLAPLIMDHVDLMEVAPGRNGLKTYGGRLHAKKLQDLPLPHDASISAEQRPMVRDYNRNDLFLTRDLRVALKKQVDLRKALMAEMQEDLEKANQATQFQVDDLRSKSDAQIAESVLKQRVLLATGVLPRKRDVKPRPFKYVPPKYIQYKLPVLQNVLETVTSVEFQIKESGHVEMPTAIDKLDIEINGTQYKLGIGGLHSQESEVSHYRDEQTWIKDIDVTSYYPNLILNMGMYPDTMGPHFLTAYRAILDERVTAKRAGNKVKDATLKITLNGTFGKTSSRYSVLYNPKMMLYTTLTGQLAVLMLIELFERGGIHVISANTDGIVVKYHKDKEPLRKRIVEVWEKVTNLSTDETDYVSIHSRDVNSYYAIKPDGEIKRKGAFASLTLNKSPNAEVCADAVAAFLCHQTPLEDYIRDCKDITKFLVLRRVTGGAEKDGVEIGKVIRWYYSTEVVGTIKYIENGKIVGKSAGARPCMELPDEMPQDIDYHWYVKEAESILCDIGVAERKVRPKLPRRNTKLWKEAEALGLVEVDDYGKPQWAVHDDQIPEKFLS